MLMHGISDQEWEDYIEERLDEPGRDRIEAHLIGCLACWERHDLIKLTARFLYEAGAEARRSLALPDEQIHAGLQKFFARVDSRSGEDRSEIHRRLKELEAIMSPMCGTQTALQALRVAAESSPARSLEQVNVDNWEPFLIHLTEIATVMCGATGAHLVWRSGRF